MLPFPVSGLFRNLNRLYSTHKSFIMNLPGLVKSCAEPFSGIHDPQFGAMFDKYAVGKRIVLIGDASHGTSEFYTARAAITKRLIENHGFTIIALEADWPDARTIDDYVGLRNTSSTNAFESLRDFKRFPAWMWRNTEVEGFVDWLYAHNSKLEAKKRVGVYGLDLYSLSSSVQAVVKFLEQHDQDAARAAKTRYGCFTPWLNDPAQYGLVALKKGHAPCEKGVITVLLDLLKKRLQYLEASGESLLDAEMNARLVRDAERYYRAMYYGDAESWNLRDGHMFDVLLRLLAKNKNSKAVVWAHNSHVGDARFTDMGLRRGELNIGQLCREKFGSQVSIIGCGTHSGTVAAAHEWDEEMEIMKVLPSIEDSYERLMYETGIPRFVLDMRAGEIEEHIRRELMRKRWERFIGVIYRPKTEFGSHYSCVVLPRQMDAYVWLRDTTAVHAFEKQQPHYPVAVDETFPFGL